MVGGVSDSGFLLSLPSHFDHSLQTLVLFPLRPASSSVPCRMTEKESSYLVDPVAKNYRFTVLLPKNIIEITMTLFKDKQLHIAIRPCLKMMHFSNVMECMEVYKGRITGN